MPQRVPQSARRDLREVSSMAEGEGGAPVLVRSKRHHGVKSRIGRHGAMSLAEREAATKVASLAAVKAAEGERESGNRLVGLLARRVFCCPPGSPAGPTRASATLSVASFYHKLHITVSTHVAWGCRLVVLLEPRGRRLCIWQWPKVRTMLYKWGYMQADGKWH